MKKKCTAVDWRCRKKKKNSWIAHTPYTLHTERVKKTAQIIKDHISLFACSDIATVRVLYTCICMCCTVSLVKITLFSFKSGKKTTLKTGKKSIRHALIQMSAIPFNRWSLFFSAFFLLFFFISNENHINNYNEECMALFSPHIAHLSSTGDGLYCKPLHQNDWPFVRVSVSMCVGLNKDQTRFIWK